MKYLALIALAGCGRIHFDPSLIADGSVADVGVLDSTDAMLFPGCSIDHFDMLPADWIRNGSEMVTFDGTMRVDITGAMNDDSGIEKIGDASFVGRSTSIRIVQTTAQMNAAQGMGWHPADLSPAIHFTITQDQLVMDLGSTTMVSDTYVPADDVWLRLYELGGAVFGSTSPDGVTWTDIGSIALDATDIRVDLGVDSPFITIAPDFAVFDDYVECPP